MHDIDIDHEHEVTEHDFVGCCLNCTRSLEIIKPHVIEFHRRIAGLGRQELTALSPEELYRTFQALDDVARLEVGDRLAEMILAEPEIAALLPAIRSYYALFFELHERHLATDLARRSDPWAALESFPLLGRYQALVESHARAAGFCEDTRLVFIGCGAVPLSLILLARDYGVRGLGLDTDPEAAALATRCVAHLGLADRIAIQAGDESVLATPAAHPRPDWNAVIVAALAEPKGRILATLRELVLPRPDATVSYRTYTGMRVVLYQPVQPADVRGFRVRSTVPPTGRSVNTVILLEAE